MSTIDTLIADVEAMKILEDKYRTLRLDAEERLVAAVEAKAEGSVTVRGSQYKATVTFGVTRNVDQAALSAAWDSLPEGIRNVFPVKHGVDLKELRHWQNNNPDEYARYIAPVVTAKPAKPSVKLERMVERMDAAREAA